MRGPIHYTVYHRGGKPALLEQNRTLILLPWIAWEATLAGL